MSLLGEDLGQQNEPTKREWTVANEEVAVCSIIHPAAVSFRIPARAPDTTPLTHGDGDALAADTRTPISNMIKYQQRVRMWLRYVEPVQDG